MSAQLALVDADADLGGLRDDWLDPGGPARRLALALRWRRPCRDCDSDDARVWWLVPDDFWLCIPCDDLLAVRIRQHLTAR